MKKIKTKYYNHKHKVDKIYFQYKFSGNNKHNLRFILEEFSRTINTINITENECVLFLCNQVLIGDAKLNIISRLKNQTDNNNTLEFVYYILNTIYRPNNQIKWYQDILERIQMLHNESLSSFLNRWNYWISEWSNEINYAKTYYIHQGIIHIFILNRN